MANSSPLPLKAKVPAGHPFVDIIEEAYRVFDYPKPSSIEVCQKCCMDRKIEADFFNPPIWQLPLEYVRDWYFAAQEENGVAKATWAYLLPRLMEILSTGGELSYNGIEVSLSRFDTGNPQNWSSREWSVLDRFERMFLQRHIANTEGFIDNVVCLFRLGGWDLDDLIEQVKAAPSETLALRLWNDWCAWQAPGREGIWTTSFWESGDETKMLAFYRSDELYEKMEALALDDGTDPGLAAKASAVASLIKT